MISKNFTKTYGEYCEKFKGEELQIIFIYYVGECDSDALMRRAIERGKPLTKEEVINEYLGGDRERYKEIKKELGGDEWYESIMEVIKGNESYRWQ